MLQIIEGFAEVSLDGEMMVVRTGELIILPASIPHAVHAKESFKMILTMIHA